MRKKGNIRFCAIGTNPILLTLFKTSFQNGIKHKISHDRIADSEKRWKIDTNKKDIKVIILTSHDREEEVIASLGAGATGYCMKDIDPDTLADVIKQVNQGACWLDPNVCKTALKIFPRPENTQLIYKQETKDDKGHLTEREQEVLRLLVKGKSNTEIASELIVSVHTAKAHVCSILQKLCVDDRVQAAVKAIKEGLVDENSTK